MHEALQFETPENIRVQYTPAGLGTRFVAWFIDQILVSLLMLATVILLAIVGFSMFGVLENFVDKQSRDAEKIGTHVIGLIMLVIGLGSFFYYVLLELFFRGQTIGKRLCKIRVVKADGFALDPASILLRNIFRVLDHVPLLWIVPVMSKRGQRMGDMVSGTIVILDEAPNLADIRVQLSERKALEAQFRFDHRSLQRLTEQDFEAVERLLERWNKIPTAQQDALSQKLTAAVVEKLQFENPSVELRRQFLEDLLAAEFRRQNRLLA